MADEADGLEDFMTGFRGPSRLALMLSVVSAAFVGTAVPAPAAEPSGAPDVQPLEVISSLETTYGVHPGQSRNHAKGTCAAGYFVGTPTAAVLSRSRQFSDARVSVVARFSVAGGNPEVPDATSNARGMALEFRLSDGSRQHMTMLNTPVFGAANPRIFNDMILAGKPDPSTGKPDPQKLRVFLASHPDAVAQSEYLRTHHAPESYANESYYGIHTFKFIDAQGGIHPVKWRFVPQDGEKRLSASELTTAPRDFLERRLIERVKSGPVQWNMIVNVGQPGDVEDNPSIPWPETRRHFIAGTLTVTRAMSQSGAECEKINFDPLVMADGIAPTNDPVLLFRSPAYGISFGKRLSGN